SAPLRLTATAPAVSSAIALQHTARAPSHPSLAVRAPSLRADPRAPARAPAPAGPPSQELDQGVPVPALQAGAEPVELDAVATAVSTPPEMRRSAQTVIKPHPVESAAVSTSRIAAAPEANVPSTLSVTAAELRRVDPPAAGRRSWALVVGLAVAGVIAAGGTVVVLSLQGGTGDDDAAGMRAPRPAARDTDRAPEAHTAAPVAPPESAPAASPGTASAAPTAKADALTAKPSAAPKKIAARPAGAKKPVAKKGTAKPKFDLAD
ncbi:MAG TPA: hypothetical protein VG389_07540, partial [Myxococcota bacterium]|nr:hypothetical protein [Myxococcota bacterium]